MPAAGDVRAAIKIAPQRGDLQENRVLYDLAVGSDARLICPDDDVAPVATWKPAGAPNREEWVEILNRAVAGIAEYGESHFGLSPAEVVAATSTLQGAGYVIIAVVGAFFVECLHFFVCRSSYFQKCIKAAGVHNAGLPLSHFQFTEETFKAPGAPRNWIIAHKLAMPAFAKLVIKVQSTFPTSVPSEDNFSVMNRVWNPKRARLSAARAADTVFVAANYEFAQKRRNARFLEGAAKRRRVSAGGGGAAAAGGGDDESDHEGDLTEDEGQFEDDEVEELRADA